MTPEFEFGEDPATRSNPSRSETDGGGLGGESSNQPLLDQCTNREQDSGETDIDCGGPCEPCDLGRTCVLNEDCAQPDDVSTGSSSCQDGTCTLLCDDGFVNCNGEVADGCESEPATDASNCGTCGNVCGGDGSGVDEASCSDGSCAVTCTGNLCADSSAAASCTEELETSLHCGSCGNACGGATPFCSNTGSCAASLDVEVAVARAQGVNQDTFMNGITSVQVDRTAGQSETRLLVVGIATRKNPFIVPESVTFGTIPMTRAVVENSWTEVDLSIWTASECDLRAATNDNVVVTVEDSGAGKIFVEATLFDNVEQLETYPAYKTSTGNTGSTTELTHVTTSSETSTLYTIMGTWGAEPTLVIETVPVLTGGPGDAAYLQVSSTLGVRTTIFPPSDTEPTYKYTFPFSLASIASIDLPGATTSSTTCD